MRGRKPLPRVVKFARGNPGHRRVGTDPPVKPAELMPPAWLTGVARKKWEEIAPELLDAGLFSTLDRDALVGYCHAWADYVEARAHLAKHGKVIRAPSGYQTQSPYVAMARSAWASIRAGQAELGMTPSARSRVQAATPKKADDREHERFFGPQRAR